MKNFCLTIFLAATLLTTSCSEADEPDVAAGMPVIEAWIDSGGYPVALFTSAITPDEDGGEILDKLIRWGKVSISDGDTEIILTGKRDSQYMPPYKYFTYDMIGKPGRTYTIKADFGEMHAEAICTMPEPTKINSITLEPVEGSDSLRSATLRFTAPDDVPAYYYLTIDGAPSLMGWAEVNEPGIEVAVPVYNSKSYSQTGEPFVAQLKIGEEHAIALHRVSEEVYRFWRAYDDTMLFGVNVLFGGAKSLPTNIRGGLGIFSARATTSRLLLIR